jgi:glycosyltransferase involved in cell wall biosynthesis
MPGLHPNPVYTTRFSSAPVTGITPPVAAAVSVVMPVYNEDESVVGMLDHLLQVMDSHGEPFELLVVDDGSRDRSFEVLSDAASRRSEIKVVRFRRNAGQTAAMMAGIDYSSAPIIVTIDADHQNDPGDIPMLLSKLAEGCDVVSGWRRSRKDAAIRRTFVSRVANRIISRATGVRLHDYGCTLKAYRREVLEGMRLYGEMHRFVPIYASWMGAKVEEVPVQHHPRKFGKSKYGLERMLKVVLDLMVITFFSKYLVKPIYIFGGFAALCFSGSFAGFFLMLYLKYFQDLSMIRTPLPVLVSMLFLVGAMSLMMGILAEILIRTYFESRGIPAYSVRETRNLRAA